MWQEDEEEDVRTYWMTLRTGEDTLIWKRRLWIALCGGIILEEALDLSSDRLLNNKIISNVYVWFLSVLFFCVWYGIVFLFCLFKKKTCIKVLFSLCFVVYLVVLFWSKFCRFGSRWMNTNVEWCNKNWKGKTEVLKVPLCLLQIPCELCWDLTLA